MKNELKKAFSLTEVLLALGILSIGMVFVAGVFPVAIHLTTVSTEQTTAAVIADEAFAKIRLYAEGDPTDMSDDISGLSDTELRPTCIEDFNDVFPAATERLEGEFVYPSDNSDISQKRYSWSVLLREVDSSTNPPVQATVFVCRKTGSALLFYQPDDKGNFIPGVGNDWPVPIKVAVDSTGRDNTLRIEKFDEIQFINDGSTIVDDETGDIYRVLTRYKPPNQRIIELDRPWQGSGAPKDVWVIPPAANGGRNPCIAVYQRVLNF